MSKEAIVRYLKFITTGVLGVGGVLINPAEGVHAVTSAANAMVPEHVATTDQLSVRMKVALGHLGSRYQSLSFNALDTETVFDGVVTKSSQSVSLTGIMMDQQGRNVVLVSDDFNNDRINGQPHEIYKLDIKKNLDGAVLVLDGTLENSSNGVATPQQFELVVSLRRQGLVSDETRVEEPFKFLNRDTSARVMKGFFNMPGVNFRFTSKQLAKADSSMSRSFVQERLLHTTR